MIKTIDYPGIEPLFLMVLKNPSIWGECIGIEEVSEIWEKLYLNPTKTRGKKLTDRQHAILNVDTTCLESYTRLIHMYDSLPEEEKDNLCEEWNRLTDEKH